MNRPGGTYLLGLFLFWDPIGCQTRAASPDETETLRGKSGTTHMPLRSPVAAGDDSSQIFLVFYRYLLRPLLFQLPAETAHHVGMWGLKTMGGVPGCNALLRPWTHRFDKGREVEAMGLTFPNPIGMAAGFDKNAEVFEPLGSLGFGFVEIGTLTAHGQPGNQQPRLFRLPEDQALINRLGFNNRGAADAVARLRQPRRTLVGVNIGKSKATPTEEACLDYEQSARLLAPHADYLVINVSSPNTPGLRDLQQVDQLSALIGTVRKAASERRTGKQVPLVVKIAPDLDDRDIEDIADICSDLRVDGLIATNTTISRQDLRTSQTHIRQYGGGGLSGKPLAARSLSVLRRLSRRCSPHITLIASGGISTPRDVEERLDAGASLVQIYTALVYGGPSLPSKLVRALPKHAGASRREARHPLSKPSQRTEASDFSSAEAIR